ncbi:hypothetical protein BC831DRAFT_473406 [Entophlyctis helioformis]|nr:hypothetical protein BC831DRAFT_473406 [Entophlyctis helioformis]
MRPSAFGSGEPPPSHIASSRCDDRSPGLPLPLRHARGSSKCPDAQRKQRPDLHLRTRPPTPAFPAIHSARFAPLLQKHCLDMESAGGSGRFQRLDDTHDTDNIDIQKSTAIPLQNAAVPTSASPAVIQIDAGTPTDANDASRLAGRPESSSSGAGKGINGQTSKRIPRLRKPIDIDEHLMSIHDICKRYNTSVNPLQPSRSTGLPAGEATERLARHGPNVMTPPRRKHWIVKFAECLGNLFNVLLIAAGLAQWALYFVDPAANFGNTYVGSVLIGIAVVNSLIELHQFQKSAAALESFMKLVPAKCTVIRAGLMRQIPADQLVPGDLVFLHMGDKVPADMVLFAVSDLKLDLSSLTGESDPQKRDAKNERAAPNPLEAPNMAFNGTLAVTGEGYGIVVRTGRHTVLGRIAGLATSETQRPSPLTQEIERFCKIVTAVASLTAVVFFFYTLARGRGLNNALSFAVGVLVAWVPQGLPATVTMLLTIAAKRMAKQHVLVKDLHGVETLGAITLLATDKTGTLTRNQMNVVHLWIGGVLWRAGKPKASRSEAARGDGGGRDGRLEAGDEEKGSVAGSRQDDGDDEPDDGPDDVDVHDDDALSPYNGTAMPHRNLDAAMPGLQDLVRIAVLCSNARFDHVGSSSIADRHIYGDATETVFELPFTSAAKTHTVIVHAPSATSFYTLYIKGAPERVFDMCDTLLDGAGNVEQMSDAWRRELRDAYEGLAARGHRVIAFAQLVLPASVYPDTYTFRKSAKNYPTGGYCLVGLASLSDPPKRGVREAIGQARIAGIKVVMITGDHPLTAESIARQTNLMLGDTVERIARRSGRPLATIARAEATAVVVHGSVLPTLTDDDWDDLFAHDEIVFARTTPRDKLDIVKRAQAIGHIVGVTGDGVNDSPALKKADLGISMNSSASDVSKEAAGMILLDDNFASTIRGVMEGRLIFINLKKSIQYAVTHIIPEVVPYLLFAILPMPPALTSVQVLIIDLGFELMASLAFAFEPAESMKDLMAMRPRRPVTAASVAMLRQAVIEKQEAGLLPTTATAFLHAAIHGDAAVAQARDELNGRAAGDLDDNDGDEDPDKFQLPSMWKRYAHEAKRMTRWSYWVQLFAPPPGGEILVDADVLCWSYLEAGVIECVGCLVAFFAVFASFGMDVGTVVSAQRAGGHFLPTSRPLYIPRSNTTITGDVQYEALRQAQSVYYLSILIIQIWNIFACKSKLKLPWGIHMVQNTKTWYSIIGGLAFGLTAVYTPFLNRIFLTSARLNPLFLLIPCAFGAFLLLYAALRRLVLSRYDAVKRAPQVHGLLMHESTTVLP